MIKGNREFIRDFLKKHIGQRFSVKELLDVFDLSEGAVRRHLKNLVKQYKEINTDYRTGRFREIEVYYYE